MTSLTQRLVLVSSLLSLPLAYACGEEEGGSDSEEHDLDAGGDHHDGEHHHDAGHHDHDHDGSVTLSDGAVVHDDEDTPCSADYPLYEPGMSVKVGALTATLVSADPAPPRQKMPNDWNIELTDASGAKLTDCTLSQPASFMPVHNHYGRRPPSIAPLAEPGQAQVKDIDFRMRGPWQVLFDVNQGGAKVGTATFQVCVR